VESGEKVKVGQILVKFQDQIGKTREYYGGLPE